MTADTAPSEALACEAGGRASIFPHGRVNGVSNTGSGAIDPFWQEPARLRGPEPRLLLVHRRAPFEARTP